MEWFLSGYCRVQDQARTVMVELEQGQWEQDCQYSGCSFADSCPIGRRINKLMQEEA